MNNNQSSLEELHRSLVSLLQPEFRAWRKEVEDLQKRLKQVQELSDPMPAEIGGLQKDLKTLLKKITLMDADSAGLHADLKDPEKVAGLIKLGLHAALQESIEEDPYPYGQAIAPVISPAIRNQIRNSREEMVAALSPIIGQTISRAIADAFDDFRRRIDAQMKTNLNVGGQVKRFLARLRGVSDADLMIRELLPYQINHIFLIERGSGLLLKEVSLNAARVDADMISAMLTAIRDFARDALGREDRQLEEIQYGEAHIILAGGQYAYAAVVLDGVQPPGYRDLLDRVVTDINIKYEGEFRRFQGDMASLPDFEAELEPLLRPNPEQLARESAAAELNPGQKRLLAAGGCLALVLLALLIFGCVFSIRLLPAAFPGPSPTPVPPTATPYPTATPSPIPATAVPTPTALPPTPTREILPTREIFYGVMTGNVWIRREPKADSPANQVVIPINTRVEVSAVYGKWARVAWATEFGNLEGWVPLEFVGVPYEIPARLVTPEQ